LKFPKISVIRGPPVFWNERNSMLIYLSTHLFKDNFWKNKKWILNKRIFYLDRWLLFQYWEKGHLHLFSVRYFFQIKFGLKFSVWVRKLFTNHNEMQMTFLYIQLHISILLWKHSCQLLQQKLIDVVTHFVCPKKNICIRHTLI
jgi:hypothetical protein